MNILGIIPSRMASSRFPGKPMHKIMGVPMIGHCYLRSKLCNHLDELYVATCDKEIHDYIIDDLQGKSVITSLDHERAAERCAEALIKIEKKDTSANAIEVIKKDLTSSLGSSFNFRRVENVGPKVSSELLKSGIIAIALSLAAMLFYIWIRFEWQFSLGAILALFHDVIITLGLFSLFSLEINLSIVAAVLTIVGYSMNDTVVIYDRVRENLRKFSDIKIYELTNISINETLSRTIITSATTLLALVSIYLFGGEILKGFSLAMIMGVIFGTYSSIYIANPILVKLRVSQKTILKEDTE